MTVHDRRNAELAAEIKYNTINIFLLKRYGGRKCFKLIEKL